MTLLGLLIAILAFALFGFANDDHHQRRFGRRPPPARKRRMRAAAWTAVAASLPLAILSQGWVFGPVLWLGMLMLGAGIVFLSLNLPAGDKGTVRHGRSSRAR